jgi:hypothetical protein
MNGIIAIFKGYSKRREKNMTTIFFDIIRPCMDSNNLMKSISYTTEAW